MLDQSNAHHLQTADVILVSHYEQPLETLLHFMTELLARPLLLLHNEQLPDSAPDPFDYVVDRSVMVNATFIKQLIAVYRQTRQRVLATAGTANHLQQLETALQAERALNQKNEFLKNAIIHNVSHEFRTPLLHMKSGVSLLGESLRERALYFTEFALVEEATIRLESLIANLAQLGSVHDHAPSPIIVNDVIQATLRLVGRAWQTRKQVQRIIIDVEPRLAPVLADKQGLTTVLHLLLDNALKFSDGAVTIHANPEDQRIRIAIEDHGKGIPDQERERIFESFYQIDASSTRAYGGMGIGLSIVKLILDHHQTQIAIKSSMHGTTFSFSLPIVNLSQIAH